MARDPIPTWFFVLVAVRRNDRYLLVREREHGQCWCLPSGRVEPGEDFISVAKRETLEEAGIPIAVDGIIRIEHSPSIHDTRVRLVVTASPVDDTPPKSQPDEESIEARWFTIEQIRDLPLRAFEVYEIYSYLHAGGKTAPMSILKPEGAPFVHFV